MDMHELSEMLAEADFLWREIAVGDYVQVEDPVVERGGELLSVGKEYLLLAKETSPTGTKSFITETNIQGEVVRVYPISVCNYRRYQETHHC